MRKVILAVVLALSFSAFAADEDSKPVCTIDTPVAGTTIIACPTYFVTKDTNGTTVCRVAEGVGKILCNKIATE